MKHILIVAALLVAGGCASARGVQPPRCFRIEIAGKAPVVVQGRSTTLYNSGAQPCVIVFRSYESGDIFCGASVSAMRVECES